MRVYKIFVCSFLLLLLITPSNVAISQTDSTNYPVYVVQPGDTINVISIKFNVSANDIIAANNITDPNILSVNTRLIIPGIKGVSGVLTYSAVSIGENPDTLSREYQIPKDSIYQLNQTTSPSEFYIGSNVILVETSPLSLKKSSINLGQPMMEASAINNLTTWDILIANHSSSSWQLLPGETLFISSPEENPTIQEDLEFIGLPLTQGNTALINVYAQNKPIKGNIGDVNLNFFENNDVFTSLFGIHAMRNPGLYPFHLEFIDRNGQTKIIDQLILIQRGFYPQDPPLHVDPSTLDESLTKPEDELIFDIASPFTNQKYWTETFQYPVDQPVCIKSWFGNRRSYNDSPYNRFHTGVDFGVCANLNIYAPADGVIVLTDSLLTRGNSTVIDHGLGVYSGFWHQENIFVEEGQYVKAGDLIGEIGSTGRSTGPHLHWELIVNGIQVDPLPWLEVLYP
ncbi:MAG TPA: peptidoglycan DD-metalloendopeptidase family protein [Anaerolineaceae bacterium]|nr:peptidoglycan DD-metalloendopeptidase family protein [Anaerolineaceae bacterium]